MDNQLESTHPARPFALNRRTIARISSGVGGLALIVAILGLLLQHDITSLVLVSALIAIVGIALWTILAPDDFRALVSGRQALYGSNSIFISVLLAGIVAIIYTIANSSGVSVDMTSVGYYTLKRDVSPVVNSLDRPIQITAFYTSRLLSQQSNDRPTLRLFTDASPDKVKLVIVDPDEQPLVAKNFKLSGEFGIFVSYLDVKGQPDQRTTVQSDGTFANQKWIAEAILKLQAQGKYLILFSVGNGEINSDSTAAAAQQDNAVAVRQGLETQFGIQTQNIDLSNHDIPVGASALVILRPQKDFTADEVRKITQYTSNGGKLLIMASPAFNSGIQFLVPSDSPMAAYLTDTWGVTPQRDIVFDPASYSQNQYYVKPASFAAGNKILDKGSNTPIQPVFYLTQSWAIQKAAPANVNIMPLYLSSKDSFGKPSRRAAEQADHAFKEAGDLPGPLVLMLSAENTLNKSKMILLGDATWALDGNVAAFDGAELWVNSINWLTQIADKISVNPVAVQLPLNASTNDLNVVRVVTLLVLPGIVLVAGLLAWLNRLRHS